MRDKNRICIVLVPKIKDGILNPKIIVLNCNKYDVQKKKKLYCKYCGVFFFFSMISKPIGRLAVSTKLRKITAKPRIKNFWSETVPSNP